MKLRELISFLEGHADEDVEVRLFPIVDENVLIEIGGKAVAEHDLWTGDLIRRDRE